MNTENLIIAIAICLVSSFTMAQTTTENYIQKTVYKVKTQNGTTNNETQSTLTSDDKIETISYYDGIGRLKQTINKQAGGARQDAIVPVVYDEFGRQVKQYLPYVNPTQSASSTNLNYRNQASLISDIESRYLDKYSEDLSSSENNPYSEKRYEKSPLNRTLEQGAPGKDWILNDYQLVPQLVPIPIDYHILVSFLEVTGSSSGGGAVHVFLNENELVINFDLAGIPLPLQTGQIKLLDTGPYVLDNYDLGQLTNGYGDLLPYFAEIQNNYLIITSTDPTYVVSHIDYNISFPVELDLQYEIIEVEQSFNNSIRFDYKTNTADEVKLFNVSHPDNNTEQTELVYDGYYPPNTLYKTITKDENWQPDLDFNNPNLDHTSEEFKDKQGRLLLKRNYNLGEPHDTYYVYDNYNNLTYVIPPLASDEIVIEGGQNFSIDPVNYPWTRLAKVDKKLADEYDKKLSDYENEDILNADLNNKFGAQGGFSISVVDSELLVSINFSATTAIQLKTGSIQSLKEFGTFKDTELGRTSQDEYVFYIKNNSIWIESNLKTPASLLFVNETFSSSTKLNYTKNYSWAEFSDIDAKEASDYLKSLSAYTNENILNANITNAYGGQGGFNVSINENDLVTLAISINATTPISFKNGYHVPLDTKRRLADRELGSINGYTFSVKSNGIYIEGSGNFTSLVATLSATDPPTYTTNNETVEGLCYIYHHDSRNRIVEKKIPGKDWEYIIYDQMDRPILVQDANMRINDVWLFTKYDKYGRPVYTGTYENANSRTDVQVEANGTPGADIVLYEIRTSEQSSTTLSTDSSTQLYYTDNAYPNSGNRTLYTISYYDDYDVNLNTNFNYQDSYTQMLSTNNASLPTVTKVRVLETEHWITTVTYYDDKGRTIYTVNNNPFLETNDHSKIKLDFTGKVLESTGEHTKGNNAPIQIVEDITYDHADRVLKHTQSINGNEPELLVDNTYDELGQLVVKKVGGAANASQDVYGLQTVDYKHNIRGWLKSINNGNASNGDLFGFKLSYNTTDIANSSALFNSNISEVHWVTANDNVNRNYQLRYDALNRLIEANYNGGIISFPDNISQAIQQDENYSLKSVYYDKNGNLEHLERYGIHFAYAGTGGNNTMDIVDGLDYFYAPNSNTLLNVTDFADNGFSGQSDQDIDNGVFLEKYQDGDKFEYDINGNMVKDNNKNITEIEYNHLNLPVKVVFNGQDPDNNYAAKAILFTYDATGTKLQKYTVDNSQHDYTQYAANFIYKKSGANNYELEFFSHSEGYVEPDNINGFNYVYQFKDHLDNIRLSYSDANNDNIVDSNEIRQEKNYYPFGATHTGYNNVINGTEHPYGFGGKEENKEFGIEWLDFGARNYDASIGRWMNVDPLAEQMRRHSPYNYAYNNPIFFIDPDGMRPRNNTFNGTFAGEGGDMAVSAEAAGSSGPEIKSEVQKKSAEENEEDEDQSSENNKTGNQSFGGPNDIIIRTFNPDTQTYEIAYIIKSKLYDVTFDFGSVGAFDVKYPITNTNMPVTVYGFDILAYFLGNPDAIKATFTADFTVAGGTGGSWDQVAFLRGPDKGRVFEYVPSRVDLNLAFGAGASFELGLIYSDIDIERFNKNTLTGNEWNVNISYGLGSLNKFTGTSGKNGFSKYDKKLYHGFSIGIGVGVPSLIFSLNESKIND